MTSRLVPREIDSILADYQEAATSGSEREAAARALDELDQVALAIDPEQDHGFEALLEAARSRIESHAV